MLRWLRRIVSLFTLTAFAASGAVFVPPAFDAWRIVQRWDAPETSAALQLDGLLPADYIREAEAALGEDDPELAQSILTLADEKHVMLPPELRDKPAQAVADQPGVLGQVWDGAVYGEGDSAVGLAAAAVTDLMVVGDIRDLMREGWNYPDYDPVVVALAAVGVGLSVATVSSAGAAAPVKAGASLLKLAKRTGKLGARLGDDLFRLARQAVDGDALEATVRAARRLDWAEARRLGSTVLRREGRAEIVRTGEAVGAVAAVRGPRAALDTLKTAENTAEVSRLARIAETTGPAYRGALRLAPRLAKAVAKTSKVMWKLSAWIALGLFWLCWLLWTALRLCHRTARLSAHGIRFAVRVVKPRRTTSLEKALQAARA